MGRPKKIKAEIKPIEVKPEIKTEQPSDIPVKRKRGRPRKNPLPAAPKVELPPTKVVGPKKETKLDIPKSIKPINEDPASDNFVSEALNLLPPWVKLMRGDQVDL